MEAACARLPEARPRCIARHGPLDDARTACLDACAAQLGHDAVTGSPCASKVDRQGAVAFTLSDSCKVKMASSSYRDCERACVAAERWY